MAQANPGSPESNSQIKAGTADASLDDLNRDAAHATDESKTASGGLGGMSRGMAAKGSVPGSPGNTVTVQAVPSQPLIAPNQPAPRPTPVRNMPSRQNIAMENGNYYNHAREMQLNFAQQSRARSGPGVSAMRTVKNKELPKPVLVNFELKRVGNTIRVVDGDGSIYSGNVINEEAMPEAEERKLLAEPGEGGGGGGIAGGGAYHANVAANPARAKTRQSSQAFFRVQGTNKTLQQLVIFEATLDNSVLGKKDGTLNPRVVAHPQSLARPSAAGAGQAPPLSVPSVAALPEGGPNNFAGKAPKNLNGNMGAIRAIARMRVLGNARIGKDNFPVDAYLDTKAAGKAPADEIKKK